MASFSSYSCSDLLFTKEFNQPLKLSIHGILTEDYDLSCTEGHRSFKDMLDILSDPPEDRTHFHLIGGER